MRERLKMPTNEKYHFIYSAKQANERREQGDPRQGDPRVYALINGNVTEYTEMEKTKELLAETKWNDVVYLGEGYCLGTEKTLQGKTE